MNRIIHIDIAKGISIVLIVLFHSHVKNFMPQLIESMSLFRVPLFFFLSGVFFLTSIQSQNFIYKKLENLLKPYFSILLLIFLVDAFVLHEKQLLIRFLGIFYGTGETIRWIPMWFLPHLFAIHCFAYFLFRYCRFNQYQVSTQSLFLVFLFVAGLFSMNYFWHMELLALSGITIRLPGLPFSIDLLFITTAFFLTGYILREKIAHFTQHTPWLFLSTILFICITLFTNSYTNLNDRIYINPLFSSVGAVCGIYIVLCLSRLLEKQVLLKKIFITLGRGSLFILIFHGIIENKAYNIISSLLGNHHSLLLAFSIFIISITLPLLIKWLVEKNSVLSLFFLPLRESKLLKRTRLAN